ncbi:hypothetical protein [Desulforhopalus sp. IMCC35007]|uniref:hypothetical protein n=1 Tax=Desulforhopalus sp. IMCC35007 TaxID=2569543 RepID=UPI0010AE1AA8|nr:hypothetical protein [Desulforhopalus sp. IMCC35007]TKB07621.1 hypothetical protein FCL48_16465 [Desulforhopalus sp. IMCC35007]
MNNKTVVLILAIVLMVGGAIFFLPSDEKKIRNNLDSLGEYCSTVKDEPLLDALQKVTFAAKLCTDPCKVHIESSQIDHEFGQKEITDRLLMLKKRLSNTTFSFEDTFVDIPGDNRAEVTTTLRLNGESVNGRFTDAYEIQISVEKQDGDWLFSSFTVVEFMKK